MTNTGDLLSMGLAPNIYMLCCALLGSYHAHLDTTREAKEPTRRMRWLYLFCGVVNGNLLGWLWLMPCSIASIFSHGWDVVTTGLLFLPVAVVVVVHAVVYWLEAPMRRKGVDTLV
ncbi:hypothetical protein ACG04R_16435 [Roseateles sp. BYS78W]|uniref:Uncharacterized protein n=1 Tax=Pelomonas candidula TaxID=3299025 RepID=A0ABW7HED3_9BURK